MDRFFPTQRDPYVYYIRNLHNVKVFPENNFVKKSHNLSTLVISTKITPPVLAKSHIYPLLGTRLSYESKRKSTVPVSKAFTPR